MTLISPSPLIPPISNLVTDLDAFLQTPLVLSNGLRYVSLFSGGGVGDVGLVRAGWQCIAACEKEDIRKKTFAANFGDTKIFGDISDDRENIINYVKGKIHDLDLLIATPPCQSFSTANSKRGSHNDPDVAAKDVRNSLFFHAIYIAKKLRPKFFIIENVPNFFVRKVRSPDGKLTAKIGDFLDATLEGYLGYKDVMCLSSFGVPQRRKRALAIYVRTDIVRDKDAWESGSHPALPPQWPIEFRTSPLTASEALGRFRPLGAQTIELSSDPDDPLHQVPTYDSTRYRWIAEIPSDSGRSAYENETCPSCSAIQIKVGLAHCPICANPLVNRPHVSDPAVGFRLIKGFKTSYRRMRPDVPASTVTTASSHFGSDIKLHPSQNRVLSMRECAFLQTVPLNFDWSPPLKAKRKKTYALRQIIGEAIPTWFSFKLGISIGSSLLGITWQQFLADSFYNYSGDPVGTSMQLFEPSE